MSLGEKNTFRQLPIDEGQGANRTWNQFLLTLMVTEDDFMLPDSASTTRLRSGRHDLETEMSETTSTYGSIAVQNCSTTSTGTVDAICTTTSSLTGIALVLVAACCRRGYLWRYLLISLLTTVTRFTAPLRRRNTCKK